MNPRVGVGRGAGKGWLTSSGRGCWCLYGQCRGRRQRWPWPGPPGLWSIVSAFQSGRAIRGATHFCLIRLEAGLKGKWRASGLETSLWPQGDQMFARYVRFSMLELELSQANRYGWSPSLLLSDFCWSHLSLGLTGGEGHWANDWWETCSLEVVGFGGFLNIARLIKLAIRTWSTSSSTAHRNLPMSLPQILNFLLSVRAERGEEPGEVMLILWL